MSDLSPVRSRRLSMPPARCSPRRAAGLGLGAFALGGAGEALLFSEATRLLGVLVLAGALGLAVAAWHDTADTPLLVATVAAPVTQRWVLRARLAGIAGALALAGGSIIAMLAQPATVFGLQGVLWVAAMGLLLLSCARWYPATQREADLGLPWTRAEGLVVAGIIALSFFTHLAWLDTLPWRFATDEAIAFQETMRFYAGPPISLFTTTWQGTGLPSLPFAYNAGLFWLVGPGLGAERLGVALIGALTVIPVYGLARLAWGRVAAGVAAWGVAVSAVYVHYSRVSILNVLTPFWWAICFYLLLRGLRSRRPGDFVWAGLAAGTSMYTYYGTRLLPYLLLAFGGYLAVFHFRASRERLGHFALVGIGFFVGFGPLIGTFIQQPDLWMERGLQYLNIPPGIPTTMEGWVADWNILAPIVAKNFLGLSVIPNRDLVWFAPLLLPPEAVLVLLGLAVLLWRWRQPAAFLVLLWGAGVVGSGGTLLNQSSIPNFAHWTPAFPAFYLALALPVALGLATVQRLGPRAARLGGAALTAGLALLTVANGVYYLRDYPLRVPNGLSWETVQGRYLAALAPGTRVRFVGASWHPYRGEMAPMLAPGIVTSTHDLLNPSRELPLVGDPAPDLVFIFYRDEAVYLPLVQELYPGGTVRPLPFPDGSFEPRAYEVPAAAALARYGVTTTLTTPATGMVQWRGQVPAVGALPGGVTLTYPVSATWSGAILVERAAPLVLQVDGPAATITVLGAPVAAGQPLTVEAGWVPFSVAAHLDRPTLLRLLAGQGAAPAEVATTHLWPLDPAAGLAATIEGANPTHRIDLTVGAPWFGLVGARAGPPNPPFAGSLDFEGLPLGSLNGPGRLIRWEGEVYAAGGQYSLELRTDARARLWIDGAVVVEQCHEAIVPPTLFDRFRLITGPSRVLTLTPGWHAVRLEAAAGADPGGLEWLWTRPDGVREVVPPSRLRHALTPTGNPAWPAAPGDLACLR